MMGKAIGRCWVQHKGMGTVFDEPEHPGFVSVILDRNGYEPPLFMDRRRVEWRKATPTKKRRTV